jgi:hypothetical protein
VVAPTLSCLRAAATLTDGQIEWDPVDEEFSLTYSLAETNAQQSEAG